jgi:diguanylate cyclase (GGDEF)-like protein/PAS domain S-box-containing protein
VKYWSIKSRVALTVGLLFVAATGVVSIVQMQLLRAEHGRLISLQQYSLVERMARDIDAKFETGERALAGTAAYIDEKDLADPAKLRREFQEHPAWMALFDDLLVLGPDGIGIVDFPEVAGRAHVDASDREYFRRVVATRRSAISEPLLGKTRREPVVQIATPIAGRDGKLIGVLVGVIRLYRQSFLGALGDERIGTKGYFALITTGAKPRYVVHPDRTRILTERRADGATFIARALQGDEGTGEGVSSAGVETLYASKRLHMVPWVLIAAMPMEEVFAPLRNAERRLWLVSAIAALCMLPLAWLIGWSLLAPLQRLRGAMGSMQAGTAEFTPVPVERADEVGDLTDAFNRLIHDRLGAERAQRESEAQIRLLADNMPALVSYLDADLRVRFANSTYRDWFGLDPREMVGKRIDEIFGRALYDEIHEHLESALAGYPATYERELDTLTGRRFTRTALFPRVDESARVVGIYRMTTDITEDRKRQMELDGLARRDSLTGLHNRRSFEEMLPQAIARGERLQRWLAVLFVDLDRFKAVNDTHGHEAGDEVLKAVAERLLGCVRVADSVARLGGDEFTVILENLRSLEEAEPIAAKIIAALEQPIATRAGECIVGASVGIAGSLGTALAPAELVKRADAAVYAAKNAGRGTYRFAE